MKRSGLAGLIVKRLEQERASASATYAKGGYFTVDDLLPLDLAEVIYGSFPGTSQMMLRKSIREMKYVTSQMDRCQPIIEEAVYAFQDPRIVQAVAQITGLPAVEPDEKLYAGGISLMSQGHYLHPHLDNSHDMERKRYRILNLLYYTSPDWPENGGGNLELWPDGAKGEALTIHSKFNRLLVIATNRSSWHSVSKITSPGRRTCVSNYYFSPVSPEGRDYFQVTTFRGRPEQPLTDVVLRADGLLRQLVRKVAGSGLLRTKHYYRRKGQ